MLTIFGDPAVIFEGGSRSAATSLVAARNSSRARADFIGASNGRQVARADGTPVTDAGVIPFPTQGAIDVQVGAEK